MDERTRKELIALLPRLRRFARGLTGSVADADDLVQSACERAIARFEQWTVGTRLDSWMFRIIQTIFLDERRRSQRRNRPLVVVGAHVQIFVNGVDAAEARLTVDSVRRAIEVLPEEQRVVLLLVCVEGYSYEEASDALSVPMGTITSRLSRGRAALVHMVRGGRPAQERAASMRPA